MSGLGLVRLILQPRRGCVLEIPFDIRALPGFEAAARQRIQLDMAAKNKDSRTGGLSINYAGRRRRQITAIREYLGPPPYYGKRSVPMQAKIKILAYMDAKYPNCSDRQRARELGISGEALHRWRKHVAAWDGKTVLAELTNNIIENTTAAQVEGVAGETAELPTSTQSNADPEAEVAPFIVTPAGEILVWDVDDAAALARKLGMG